MRAAHGRPALGALHVLGHAVPAVADVAALAEHVAAIRVFVLDGVVVKNLAVVDAGTNLAAAQSLATRRMGALNPVDDVKIVDVLLIDVVAAQPDEVVPVAHLVFHLGELASSSLLKALAVTHPYAAAVPVGTCGDDIADGTVLNALDDFLIAKLMMALQANADLKVFLFGLCGGGQHLADALAVDGHRLLHEDVLALLDRLGKVDRPKARGRRQDHHVGHADGFFVGIETDELILLFHVRFQAVIFL